MSLRDDIADIARDHSGMEAIAAWELSGALMPLVERAVRAAAYDACMTERAMECTLAHIDAIVARVTGKGEL